MYEDDRPADFKGFALHKQETITSNIKFSLAGKIDYSHHELVNKAQAPIGNAQIVNIYVHDANTHGLYVKVNSTI